MHHPTDQLRIANNLKGQLLKPQLQKLSVKGGHRQSPFPLLLGSAVFVKSPLVGLIWQNPSVRGGVTHIRLTLSTAVLDNISTVTSSTSFIPAVPSSQMKSGFCAASIRPTVKNKKLYITSHRCFGGLSWTCFLGTFLMGTCCITVWYIPSHCTFLLYFALYQFVITCTALFHCFVLLGMDANQPVTKQKGTV